MLSLWLANCQSAPLVENSEVDSCRFFPVMPEAAIDELDANRTRLPAMTDWFTDTYVPAWRAATN